MNSLKADHADVRVHPPLLLLFHILIAFLLHWWLPLPFGFPQALVWVGYALVAGGLSLAASAASQLMRAHTTLDPHGSVTSLVTGGPYRFTRNPIYLGFVCLLIGLSFIFQSYWGLILAPALMVSLHRLVIRYEEFYLEKKFGETYSNYKSDVKRWL